MRPVLLSSAILALTLVLTLGFKIALVPPPADGEKPGEHGPLVAFLERQGFVVGPPLPDVGPSMIPAQRPGCSLRIAEVSPYGWHRDVLAQLARPNERLFFVFRGRSSTSQPVWQTFADHNWHRLMRYVGLPLPERPVLGVIASSDCGTLDLPWSEIAELH